MSFLQAAASAFNILFKSGGGSAVESVIPTLLSGLEGDPEQAAQALEGLRVILGVRPQTLGSMVSVVLPDRFPVGGRRACTPFNLVCNMLTKLGRAADSQAAAAASAFYKHASPGRLGGGGRCGVETLGTLCQTVFLCQNLKSFRAL